ncbi:MAG: tRNA guanosine(34) transglycosylase Tgt [Phycisphaeraceae bacterium]|nr:tRNA guanosine(34) transglycosylase Tgt [Phycisphaeraceae bacterium]
MPSLTFDILERSPSCHARVGRVTTPHGSFSTPAFMPVGTKASVKGILPGLVRATGSEVILANTYHLLLRPGPELVDRRGGLHEFMRWDGPILTDSGGYQVYSLGDINAATDDGVKFKSVVDGSAILMTPERSMDIQHKLGADIIMAFDDCPPSVDPATMSDARRRMLAARTGAFEKGYDHDARLDLANERTIRWLERCKHFHESSGRDARQALFGIVQGGTDLVRRDWSIERVCAVDLPGYAIGGVAVGEGFDQIVRVVGHCAPRMPAEKPRYLMGVGYERDLVAAVRSGVDMFDCVLPTRNGRNANAFTSTGQIRLRNAKFAEDDRPVEAGCDCAACSTAWGGPYSRAYIRHLFMSDEMLGPQLVSLHNVRHFQRLMLDIRAAVRDDCWLALAERWPVAAPGVAAGV